MTALKGGYMSNPTLYRKRLIPEECILLKDDRILHRDDQIIVTGWYTLKPRKDIHHGFSCYYLTDGFKISRFYKDNDSMAFWYCDIVDHTYDADTDTYVFTDLLVDVIVYTDGFVKVVDLDELAEALEKGLILMSAGTNVIRFVPPLVIEKKHVDEMTAVLDKIL